jgi:glucose-1-phosphate adenylyltransferase
VEQRQVRAVALAGYWRDLGRPSAYLQGHRDLLAGEIDALAAPGRPVISKWQDRTAARVRRGAVVQDSIVSPSCDIAGEVVRSVLGPGVVVEPGARVEDCVLFDDVVVRRGATVATSVVDERCLIGEDARVGAAPRSQDGAPEDDEVTMLGLESTVGRGVVLPAGSRLEPGTSA